MNQRNYSSLTSRQLDLLLKDQHERLIIKLRLMVTYSLLIFFAVSVFSVLTIVFFVGFGKMSLSHDLILTLIGATITQAAAIFLGIARFLFPTR